MCRCDPTRGQTCRRCADGIEAAEDAREGRGPGDWSAGQADYERLIFND